MCLVARFYLLRIWINVDDIIKTYLKAVPLELWIPVFWLTTATRCQIFYLEGRNGNTRIVWKCIVIGIVLIFLKVVQSNLLLCYRYWKILFVTMEWQLQYMSIWLSIFILSSGNVRKFVVHLLPHEWTENLRIRVKDLKTTKFNLTFLDHFISLLLRKGLFLINTYTHFWLRELCCTPGSVFHSMYLSCRNKLPSSVSSSGIAGGNLRPRE
jgi:hypothetical protein